MAVRALIIDDQVSSRGMLRSYLTSIGCEIAGEATDTLQALELFRRLRPELVLLEIAVLRKGGLGALTLFRHMRKEARWMPIVVVTTLASPDARQSFLDEGALDYLVKPLDGASLEWIRRRLENEFPELENRPQPHSEHHG
jgi:DNA-binding response OmpR family regulator